MDNVKGKWQRKLHKLLDITSNTTDHLQPMDASFNKPAKASVQKEF